MAAEMSGRHRGIVAPRPRFNEAAANGRGNPAARRARRASRTCFNEAAANGRGNGEESRDAPPAPDRFNEAAANGRGNARRPGSRSGGAPPASMRPRRMAAEMVRARILLRRGELRASMRPRRMAAEISTPRAPARQAARFNEAAANGRGNQPAARRLPRRAEASMRPRRMAAEINSGARVLGEEFMASMRPRRMAAEMRYWSPTCRAGTRLQ